MERRDTLQVGKEDGPREVPERVLHAVMRLVRPPANRRLAVRRLAIPAALLTALVWCYFALGRVAIPWLHTRPAYRLRFADIELKPPPPAWIKSGRAGLLERVRTRAGWPETFALLDARLADLAEDFRRECPWARAVPRVKAVNPNRVVVELEYREPVAACVWPGPPRIVDRDGVVLPDEDFNPECVRTLIKLLGLAPTGATPANFEAQPGRVFKFIASPGAQADTEPTREAARLAAYFHGRSAVSSSTVTSILIVAIHRTPQGLYAQTEDGALILWGDPPGSEPPGELTADQKWALLAEWVANGTALSAVAYPRYVAFERGHLVIRGVTK
jgi:hypothetical protein